MDKYSARIIIAVVVSFMGMVCFLAWVSAKYGLA